MLYAFVAAVTIACCSLVGAAIFGKHPQLSRFNHFVLPTAVGVFLGVVFFELIPETLEASHEFGPVTILIGLLGFYLLSHFLDTFHHHHEEEHDTCAQNGARKILIGDAIHNVADGIVITSAFMLDPTIGILTTIGIALHEIPQEIAEFGVLVHSGCTRMRAAIYNFLSATSVILGVAITYLFAHSLESYAFVLTGIAAGNLLYIAIADLIPELRESHRDHFGKTFVATLLGVVLIATVIFYAHEIGHGHSETDEHTELDLAH